MNMMINDLIFFNNVSCGPRYVPITLDTGTCRYVYHVKQCSSKENFYPTTTPSKKLIDEAMPEPTRARCNAPSVVARLMGVDMLPLDIKTAANAKRNKNARDNIGEKDKVENHSTLFNPPRSKHIKEIKYDFPPHGYRRDHEYGYNNLKSAELRSREHPQEEELQKFKKEFEAWQASKAWECSSSVDLENSPRQVKNNQTPSEDNLYNEMMAYYTDSRRNASHQKHTELMGSSSPTSFSSAQIDDFRHHVYKSKQRNRSKSYDFKQSLLENCREKCGRSSLCSKIVLLKPGPERTDDGEKFWVGSPEAVKDESGTEEFLKKVKERLEFELKGNVKKESTITGGEFVPLSERPTDPKMIAQLIAKKVRESVMREFKTNLPQSKSTRLYKSEAHLNELGYSNFIDKDTGKFLSERLRNILINGTNVDIPFIIKRNSSTSLLDSNEEQLITEDVSVAAKKISQRRNKKEDCGVKTKSVRYEQNKYDAFGSTEVLPTSLVRSSSATLSGTSLWKLLSDKPDVLASAHIRRKHEVTEDFCSAERKASKQKVGFRGKVSNLRYSFNLRGRLFGRKLHSVEESKEDEFDMMKAFMTEPTVMRNFSSAKDNSTEVPPSPASVCSSPHREFSRPDDHSNLVSTLAVPDFEEDQPMPQVFREISSNLLELKRQLDQLQCSMSHEVVIKEDPPEPNLVDSEGEAQVYIRDVLVAVGIYDGPSMLTCPIQSKVFEEVESAYKRNGQGGQEGDGTDKAYGGRNVVDHKLLFDLLNEALSAVLRPPITRSGSLRGLVGPPVVPQGKKLLDYVWRMIHTYLNPPQDECHSFDDTVPKDLWRTPWSGMMQGETYKIGREMECVIFGELVEEIMKDMCAYYFST